MRNRKNVTYYSRQMDADFCVESLLTHTVSKLKSLIPSLRFSPLPDTLFVRSLVSRVDLFSVTTILQRDESKYYTRFSSSIFCSILALHPSNFRRARHCFGELMFLNHNSSKNTPKIGKTETRNIKSAILIPLRHLPPYDRYFQMRPC